jgi:hypothetical protein
MIKSVDCIDILYGSENGYPPKIQWILIICPIFQWPCMGILVRCRILSHCEPLRSMPKLAEPPVSSPKESEGTAQGGKGDEQVMNR